MPSIKSDREPAKALSLPVLDANGKVASAGGRKLWRSAEERALPVDRAAAAAEFPPGASELAVGAAEQSDGVSRRSFVQLLGASVALAGAGCFNKPAERIAAYTKRPEDMVPGNPLHYATSFTLEGVATGILVTSHEGRPTKVEGNPEHPTSLGSSGLFEQASVLSLYDPHRARLVKEGGVPRSHRSFFLAMAKLGETLRAGDKGKGLAFLLEPDASPLLASVRGRLREAFPAARFYQYSAGGSDAAAAGATAAFGEALEPRYDFEKADVVLSLDADFLNSKPWNLRHMRGFASRRTGEEMNRLYTAECALTPTGMSSDHRLRLRSSQVLELAQAVAGQLHAPELAKLSGGASSLSPEAQKFAAAVAKDLAAHRGRSLVVAGERQPAAVHALAYAINAALGNVPATVSFAKPLVTDVRSGLAGLRELASDLRDGKVQQLFVTARNPVHSAPADLDLAAAIAKAPLSVYLAQHEDETASQCRWFLPSAHELESWGDGRAHDGTITFRQPLLAPLFQGLTELEALSSLLGEADRSPYQELRELHRARAGADFETTWTRWISQGFIEKTAEPARTPSVRHEAVAEAVRTATAAAAGGIEVNFALDQKLHDGRYGNNAWLQELPDPVSKITWDNAALLSPATAAKLSVDSGDVVEVKLGARTLRAPVQILPGHADDAVTLPLGYGRTSAGEEVARDVGFNAALLRTTDAPWFKGGGAVTRLGGVKHRLAITHSHWTMENRALALDVKLSELRERKLPEELESQKGPLPTMYEPRPYPGNRWAMAIDLGKCTGCSACVVACQAENNIPVVGKEQVLKSREMHWLRIDRYFQGPLEDPQVITQPVACVHCENAPCEYVCPVNATVHSDEGLNDMVYNRCVGTRYCSNNCPYKVRRFNFFNYTGKHDELEKMQKNPDVTVRSRGVMEKCTYCVQRIERVRIRSRVAGEPMRDGDIVTACQQACPANAIAFGSLSDPQAQVTRLHAEERRYDLLHDLNTRPRTAYLARVRNPNPELG